MRYEIAASAEGCDYLGGIRIRADTAKKALERAEEMARRGMRQIKIMGPDGRCYDTLAFRATPGLHLSPSPKSLDPEAIQIAVSAYEAVVGPLNRAHQERSLPSRVVARHILERMFSGERNPVLLRDGAMARLRSSTNAVGLSAAAAR